MIFRCDSKNLDQDFFGIINKSLGIINKSLYFRCISLKRGQVVKAMLVTHEHVAYKRFKFTWIFQHCHFPHLNMVSGYKSLFGNTHTTLSFSLKVFTKILFKDCLFVYFFSNETHPFPCVTNFVNNDFFSKSYD